MANQEPKNITFDLAGETVALLAASKAAARISKETSGLFNAQARVMAFDVDVINLIVLHGLGLSSADLPAVEEKTYTTGYETLAGICIAYLDLLTHGGKPAPPVSDSRRASKGRSRSK